MLFEESERVKIRMLAAFDRLYEKGFLSREEREEVAALLDGMDELPPDEFEARVKALRDRVAERAGTGGGSVGAETMGADTAKGEE